MLLNLGVWLKFIRDQHFLRNVKSAEFLAIKHLHILIGFQLFFIILIDSKKDCEIAEALKISS